MSMKLNVSSALDPLAALLSRNLSDEWSDPFRTDWVVTQTGGMDIWLRQQLASRHGIVSNIRFCGIDDVVSAIYFMTAREGGMPLDRESMRWGVYALLGGEDFREAYPEIAGYYAGNDIKRISLADEVVDLFDQYQVYRYDRIGEWNGPAKAEGGEPDWQEWLWRRLRARIGEGQVDRTQMSDGIVKALENPDTRARVRDRFPALHVFGVAILTDYHLRILQCLSRDADIHIYLVNPAPDRFWPDDITEKMLARLQERFGKDSPQAALRATGNDLLLGWGRVLRESLSLILSKDALANAYESIDEGAADEPKTLLSRIQHDIRNNHNREERIALDGEAWKDGSVAISGSYTRIREVEALYNHLVALVDGREDALSARDILVMVTDIDTYAPYIRAVFKYAPCRFPFTIADQTLASENNMFSALQELLAMEEDRMHAENVLQLLESPYIRRRFGITDTDAVRNAVRQAGIVHGIDGRENDGTRHVSWNYGLKRILYGLCMSGSPEFHDGRDVVIPLDTDEGTGAMERVRLVHFLNELQKQLEGRRKPRTIVGWAAYLRELMEEMVFQSGESDDEDHPRFIALIEKMSTLEEAHPEEVGFEVFRHSFLGRLRNERRSQKFLGEGITFCSPVPMRSISFKVVCMLGMEFDKFPRREERHSFSLITREPRKGDRNLRNNDRHLFLETVMSAGEHLYLSYLSRSEKDGSALPPSVLVDELVDYVAQGVGMDTDELRRKWVRQHPLHGFSARYTGIDGMNNYLPEARYRTRLPVRDKPTETEAEPVGTLDIDRLVRFLEDPSRGWLQHRLGIRYDKDGLLLPDHEPFEPGTLEAWKFKQDLTELGADEVDAYATAGMRKGGVPLANMGRAHLGRIHAEVEALQKDLLEARNGAPEESMEVDLAFGDIRLTGRIKGIHADRLISVCHSSSRHKYMLGAWVRYLALAASGNARTLCFLATKAPGQHRIAAAAVGREEAYRMLEFMVQAYARGLQDFFPFHPYLCDDGYKLLPESYEAFREVLEDQASSEQYNPLKDDYTAKAIEQGFFREEAYEELKQHVRMLMDPVLERLPGLVKAGGRKKKD